MRQIEILIGTNNLNKFDKYKDAFGLLNNEIKLLKPVDLNINEDPTEDSESLLGNAIKKAKFFAEKSGLITVSDDTGLFVDALDGEPGLHAKRWHAGTDHDRCIKLLERLKNKIRTARYKWATVAYNPKNKEIWKFEFELEGLISDEIRDVGGFGYDKIFNVLLLNKHFSELSKEELLEVGGRQKAIKELLLNSNFLLNS